ncbi:hypothetical protein [Lutibacter sp.]|uniref:hypothetical protein n=1 Tax=Lutibacter sp. TaxID=1925666 RepID=UPI001A2A4F03|nr:hypothetical protein [Lutibacter sp.]MBI9042243.1 hypothetical protein [Lutibacter sp.]
MFVTSSELAECNGAKLYREVDILTLHLSTRTDNEMSLRMKQREMKQSAPDEF